MAQGSLFRSAKKLPKFERVRVVHQSGDERACLFLGRLHGGLLIEFAFGERRIFDGRNGIGVKGRMREWHVAVDDFVRLCERLGPVREPPATTKTKPKDDDASPFAWTFAGAAPRQLSLFA